jgi:hypothetical protein
MYEAGWYLKVEGNSSGEDVCVYGLTSKASFKGGPGVAGNVLKAQESRGLS